jgi:hypothetical protein
MAIETAIANGRMSEFDLGQCVGHFFVAAQAEFVPGNP